MGPTPVASGARYTGTSLLVQTDGEGQEAGTLVGRMSSSKGKIQPNTNVLRPVSCSEQTDFRTGLSGHGCVQNRTTVHSLGAQTPSPPLCGEWGGEEDTNKVSQGVRKQSRVYKLYKWGK